MDQFIKSIIQEAGKIALSIFEGGVSFETKTGRNDLVTKADHAVSDFLIREIQKKYPTHHIHSEELAEDINRGSTYEWVIDPIDATWNFAFGIPVWCILIALVENGETLHGAAYSPITSELFFATRGRGATRNSLLIHVGTHIELEGSRGFFHVNPKKPFTHQFGKAIQKGFAQGVQIRDYLAGHVKCFVADGRLDFFYSNSGQTYDYLVPKLVCEEAGALVTDIDGNAWQRGREDMVIANPVLHAKVLDLLQE